MEKIRKLFKSPALIISIVAVAAYAAIPLITSSPSTYSLVNSIAISAAFALSFNLLAGYTGILSLGHALFFGGGAYIVAMMMHHIEPTLTILLLAVVVTLIFAILTGLLVGYLTLRLKAVYYAMITFALAELMVIGAEKMRNLTGGIDGLSFQLPEFMNNRILIFYIVLVFTVGMILLMRQFLDSPTGKVLVAIRENEQRAAALGYNVFRYKLISSVIAGVMAGLAGVVFAIDSRFVMNTILSADKTIAALLMVIVGGIGTLLGPVIGAIVITLAGDWLSSLAKLNPIFERWPLIFGLLYIVIVLTMPIGIMGGYYRFRFWLKQKMDLLRSKNPAAT